MFHSGTQTLIDHWTALPGAERIPARSTFDPMALRGLTPQLFTADRTGVRLRLAGGWIERAHGRALGGVDWLTLWREDAQPMVAAAIVQSFREARPVVLVAEAAGLQGPLEIVVAPLRSASGEADRLLGLYQPTHSGDRNAEMIGLLSARLSVGVGLVARADNDTITIGENSNVQERCVLHVDPGEPLTIGKNVTVGHMAMLHGCTIGDNSLIGIGAIVMGRAVIGKNCLIGAGALITEGKVIPDNSVVMGAPGKVVKEVSPAQEATLTMSAQSYVQNWKRMAHDMKPA